MKKPLFFWMFAIVLIFFMLGSADLWTQEWRWADIVWRMRFSHDYFHPNLAGHPYLDKPFLSYWFMLLTTHVFGLNEWGLRLPSAIASVLVLFSTISLGKSVFNKNSAYLAAWMLLTTYFFIFWSRVASADMLNVAGVMLALAWYFNRKNSSSFFTYSIFFLILAVTSLIKGLIAIALVGLVIFPDLVATNTVKQHLNVRFFLAALLGLFVYFLPFLFSNENALYLVYRENILRFLVPFDHKDPWYSYFLYLPLYTLPWCLWVPVVFFKYKKSAPWTAQQKSFYWSLVLVFLFFTLSGSRRSYYILPMVPLVMLWIAALSQSVSETVKYIIVVFYFLLFLWFSILQPLYFKSCGIKPFVNVIKEQAMRVNAWKAWRVVMIESDDRVGFYLQPREPSLSYRVFDEVSHWDTLLRVNTILVFPTRKASELKKIIAGHRVEWFESPRCQIKTSAESISAVLILS